MSPLAATTVDLARLQFATTSIYHFLFVPLTLGLGPIVAIMQTRWHRTGDEAWLRLTKFFGTLLLINFAIGVATGLVQEFQFGMNWSVYSKYVGGVFGAPLAIEGLAAFFLESTFLGLWIFGWDRLSPRLHLATLWVAVAGTWMSGYFILVANSWMQHPVGSKVSGGEAQLTDVWALLSNRFALYAFTHTMLVALTMGSLFVFGIACWHLLRGRNVDLFRRAAALALVVAVPATVGNMVVGSRFGLATTDYQPMKIASAEALWNTEKPAGFSLFQIGGFTQSDQKPSFVIQVPKLLSVLATGTLTGQVEGINEVNKGYQKQYGKGNYIPPVRVTYWSMRVMAYLGALMTLVALLGAFFYRRGTLEGKVWFLRTAVAAIAFPYLAATAGWLLTEVGRQPWIVQGLLKTVDANSPSVGTAMLAVSLGVFVALYAALGVLDVVLMRRYARLDPPELERAAEPPVAELVPS
ncbi:cytochrome ubiquinol oxidase subunit I [Baekduia sp.]|uniref:cytochrome ubiquinol oxidase subunit I n=1 Tax=Baekduia sp. TaxID=2600305 RepID=UPI002DFFC790|nr:cytochrome ubiquinol oxidase subunit I [Baekduia sp.]